MHPNKVRFVADIVAEIYVQDGTHASYWHVRLAFLGDEAGRALRRLMHTEFAECAREWEATLLPCLEGLAAEHKAHRSDISLPFDAPFHVVLAPFHVVLHQAWEDMPPQSPLRVIET